MKTVLGIFVCLAVVGLAASVAEASKEAVWQAGDENIILSDMPLKVAEKLEGEHAANDYGPIMILVIEKECPGTPI